MENVVGLEDEDPNTIPSANLRKFEETKREHDVALLQWKGRRIILISPRLEEWVLTAARWSGIDVRDRRYGLPDEADRLKKVINKRLPGFRNLVEDLTNHPGVKVLRNWLSADD
jgi:hypothetical protein